MTTEPTDLQAKLAAATTRPMPRPKPVAVKTQDVIDNITASEPAVEAESVQETSDANDMVMLPEAAPTAVKVNDAADEDASKADEAIEVTISDNSVLAGSGSLAIHEALKYALGGAMGKSPVFKVAALQSAYTAEVGALAFEDISRIQASAVDAYAARMKLLRTIHSRVQTFSCGPIKFQDWLKLTSHGDYNTILYGLYAATYPGENEFDVNCGHCGRENKLTVNVNDLPRIMDSETFSQRLVVLLDPNVDHSSIGSMVGKVVQRKLPESNIVAEVRNPSIQDYLDGVQWFTNANDKNTGMLPESLAGAEVIRALTMHVSRLLVPKPNSSQYLPVTDQAQRASIIGRMSRRDGEALAQAVASETKRLEVEYSIPEYNCPHCNKRNSNQLIDFEALLFMKLQGKA